MSSFTSWSQLCSHRMMERPWTVPLTGLTAVRLQPAKINTSIIRFGERAASKTLFWEAVVGSPCVTSNFLLSASAKHIASSLKTIRNVLEKKKKKKTAKEHTNNNSQLPVLMSNTSDDCASHASLEFWKKMFPSAWKCLKFWPTAERVRKKKKGGCRDRQGSAVIWGVLWCRQG